MPALLGHLRCVAKRDRPRTRWIHNKGPFSRDEPLVVGRVIPGRRILRIEFRQFGAVFKRLAYWVGFNSDLRVCVDQDRTKRVEHAWLCD